MKGKDILLMLLTAALFMACTGDDNTYSSYHCNLYINNSTHQDATLQSAMNPASPGKFCKITYVSSPRPAYSFSTNQGQSSTSPFNDIDTQSGNANRIGMNNGLYVGYANMLTDLNGGYTFVAYDGQCPNCFDFNKLPLRNYPIVVNSAGIATCTNCKRQYNLNTGGNCINSTSKGDKGLTRYRASTAGPLGMLYVN
jgi:hypothetical protein